MLVAGWSWLLEMLVAGWSWLLEMLVAGWSWLLEMLVAGWSWLLEMLVAAWSWLLEMLVAGWSWLLEMLVADWPGLLAPGVPGVREWQVSKYTHLVPVKDLSVVLLTTNTRRQTWDITFLETRSSDKHMHNMSGMFCMNFTLCFSPDIYL